MPRRSIDTSIWNDDRFAMASPEAKLVYFRLITGDDTGPAGATRVHSRRLAADTGLSTKRAEIGVEELVGSGLVRRYDGGWQWLPSWIRYQVAGPNFCRAVRRQAKECPEALQKAIGRALDEHAPRQESDRTQTEKEPVRSRNDKGYPNGLPTVSQGSANPSGGGTGPGPGPEQTSGLFVLVRDSDAAGAGGAGSAVSGEGEKPDESEEGVQLLSDDLVQAMAGTSSVMAQLLERRRLADLAAKQEEWTGNRGAQEDEKPHE